MMYLFVMGLPVECLSTKYQSIRYDYEVHGLRCLFVRRLPMRRLSMGCLSTRHPFMGYLFVKCLLMRYLSARCPSVGCLSMRC
jgi:hypothetical protein